MEYETENLTDVEAAIYDRQIRVWGVKVQKKLQEAKVLILGCNGIASEIAKNIVLAGVGNVTLFDYEDNNITYPENFLVKKSYMETDNIVSMSAETLRAMNPHINIYVTDKECLRKEELFKYNLVVSTGGSVFDNARLNWLCREAKTKFCCSIVATLEGWMFADLGVHQFGYKNEKGQLEEDIFEYITLENALKVDEDNFSKKTHHLYYCIRACMEFEKTNGFPPKAENVEDVIALAERTSESSLKEPEKLKYSVKNYIESKSGYPTSNAVLGGLMANEIVKIVSMHEEPFINFCFYSMVDGKGVRHAIGIH